MVFKIGKKWNHSKCPSAYDMACIVNYRLGELNGRHFFSEIAVLSSEALFLVCSLSLAIWFLERWKEKASCLFSFYVLTFTGFCVRDTCMPVVFVKRSEDSMQLDFSPSTLWVLGIKLKSLDLVASPPAEPSSVT